MEITIETLYAAQKGDIEAQHRLMHVLYAPVYHFIQKRVGNRDIGDELCQTVFLKCYEHLAQYRRQDGSVGTWIFRIARNTLIDYYRKKRSEPVDDLREIPATDTISDTSAYASNRIDSAYVAKLLTRLDSEEADVVTLRSIKEMPYDEIARIIDKSEEATRKIHSRALMRLRVFIEEDNKTSTL